MLVSDDPIEDERDLAGGRNGKRTNKCDPTLATKPRRTAIKLRVKREEFVRKRDSDGPFLISVFATLAV